MLIWINYQSVKHSLPAAQACPSAGQVHQSRSPLEKAGFRHYEWSCLRGPTTISSRLAAGSATPATMEPAGRTGMRFTVAVQFVISSETIPSCCLNLVRPPVEVHADETLCPARQAGPCKLARGLLRACQTGPITPCGGPARAAPAYRRLRTAYAAAPLGDGEMVSRQTLILLF